MRSKDFDSDSFTFKMQRINHKRKDDDEIYFKQNENRPYEFLNSFDLIYSEISNRIRNCLNEKLTEIECSNNSQEREIMSLMNKAYDCKRELDKMLNDLINTNEKLYSRDITNGPQTHNNLIISQPEVLHSFNTHSNPPSKSETPAKNFSCSTDKNKNEKKLIQSNDTDASGKCRVSVIDNVDGNTQNISEKKSENNFVSYNINNNYFKSFFSNPEGQSQSQSQSISSSDLNSRQNSFPNNKKNLQVNNLINAKIIDSLNQNNLLNIIQSIKENKSKNNPKADADEIIKENETENLPFSYKKRKPPSDGNFSNSNTTTHSKQTRNNSDKVENLFLKTNSNKNVNSNLKSKNKNIKQQEKIEKNEKFPKIEKITNQLRGSYTPIIHKESRKEKKPPKIIKNLFFDKKSMNISREDEQINEKNVTNINPQQFYTNSENDQRKEIDLVEHIQIDLYGSSIFNQKSNSSLNFQEFFTNKKNENIIVKLFDYCETNSEKIKIKNISKLTRLKFYDNEMKNLENLIEYKKRDENPLNKLEITNKEIFSKKLILCEMYEKNKSQSGFKNFITLIYSALFNQKIYLISTNEITLKNLIDQIESYLNKDLNIYSKYKEIIKNLKSRNEIFFELKEIKKETKGNFFLDMNQFLKDSMTKNSEYDLDVFIELSESINKLLEEDAKMNFEVVIDIEILKHRKELLIYYKQNLNSKK